MHMERVREFLTMAESGGWDTVAVFSHGGSIHCMLDIVMGAVQNKADYPCGNGSVSVFEYADGAWSLAEWGRME